MSHSSQPHHFGEGERERTHCIMWLKCYLHMITVCLEGKPISVLVSLSISGMIAEE